MPVYEYECCDCCYHFERKQGFDEEPVAMCPKCQAKARRVINSVPVIFKGSGFYITDSRKAEDSMRGDDSGKGKESTPKKAGPEGK